MTRTPRTLLASAAGLALVAAALVLTGPWLSPASGDLVSASGPYTVLTVESNNNEDILLVLDGRSETLMVFRTDRSEVNLVEKIDLPRAFADARARFGRR